MAGNPEADPGEITVEATKLLEAVDLLVSKASELSLHEIIECRRAGCVAQFEEKASILVNYFPEMKDRVIQSLEGLKIVMKDRGGGGGGSGGSRLTMNSLTKLGSQSNEKFFDHHVEALEMLRKTGTKKTKTTSTTSSGSQPLLESWTPNVSQVKPGQKITSQLFRFVFLGLVDHILRKACVKVKIGSPGARLQALRDPIELNSFGDPWEVIDLVETSLESWLPQPVPHTKRKCPTPKKKQVNQTDRILAKKLVGMFRKGSNKIMQALGYCCGWRRVFNPRTLFCFSPNQCRIEVGDSYHFYKDNEGFEYEFCFECFKRLPGKMVDLGNGQSVPLEKFEKRENTEIEMESFIECSRCQRRQHQVCVLHVWEVDAEKNENVFVCDHCRQGHLEDGQPIPEKKKLRSAGELPECALSDHMEAKVNRLLQGEVVEGSRVYIRVIGKVTQETRLLPEVEKTFRQEYKAVSWPYQMRAIFAFQRRPISKKKNTGQSEVQDQNQTEFEEVAFFAFYPQEYSQNCSSPNQGKIYLAYLDSVHFFEPRRMKTEVYHEILLGYLDYMRNHGFSSVHIWPSPPPHRDDDYIFYCHPLEQKKPNPNRLCDWYEKLLSAGFNQNIIKEYSYQGSKEIAFITEIPYFAGDLWPLILDQTIKEVSATKVCKPAGGKSRFISSSASIPVKQQILQKVNHKAKLQMYRYFVAQLNIPEDDIIRIIPGPIPGSSPSSLEDSQRVSKEGCPFFWERFYFLDNTKRNRLEFSSLRRATYATAFLLQDLYQQRQQHNIETAEKKNTVKKKDKEE